MYGEKVVWRQYGIFVMAEIAGVLKYIFEGSDYRMTINIDTLNTVCVFLSIKKCNKYKNIFVAHNKNIEGSTCVNTTHTVALSR